MKESTVTRQLLDFQRTAFEAAFTTWILVQEQANLITGALYQQTSWLPVEGKRQYNQWMDAYSKGMDGFKYAIDESFNILERFISPTDS